VASSAASLPGTVGRVEYYRNGAPRELFRWRAFDENISTNDGDFAESNCAARTSEPGDFRATELTFSVEELGQLLAGADEADSDGEGGGGDYDSAGVQHGSQRAHVSDGEKSARDEERGGNGGDARGPNKRGRDGGRIECNLQEQREQCKDSGMGVACSVKRDLRW